MAVTPQQMLDAAATLMERGDGEADWRNAASQAYYGAFHQCSAVAEEARLQVAERGGVHAALIDALTRGLTPTRFKSLGICSSNAASAASRRIAESTRTSHTVWRRRS